MNISVDFNLATFKKHSKIIHEDGVTTASKLSVSELTEMIEIVEKFKRQTLVEGIITFFLLFFVYESWLMRGLPL